MLKLGLPSFSRKKLIIIGFLLVLLIGIPITVFIVQQQTQTKSGATKATTLALLPARKTANVGDPISLDVDLTPGVNQVNFVKFVVKYDPNILKPADTSFTVNPSSNLSILAGPTDDGSGNISVTLSVGAAFQNAIQAETKIGTFSFTAQAPTSPTTTISFDETQTQIRSLGSSDTATENVLSSTTPSIITINGTAPTATPSPTPTATPAATLKCTLAANPTSVNVGGTSTVTPSCTGTPSTYSWTTSCGTLDSTSSATTVLTAPSTVPTGNVCTVTANICDSSNNCVAPTADVTVTQQSTNGGGTTGGGTTGGGTTGGGTTGSTNAVPLCQTLTLDKANSGTAPYTLNFTATGADNDGTVSKVTFNFGDGVIQDSTDGAGSSSVSTQLSHTYNNPGSYTASATITDNAGGVSSSTSCTQTITITSGLAQASPSVAPTILPSTGPDKTIFGIGALGAALSIIGVILFLAL